MRATHGNQPASQPPRERAGRAGCLCVSVSMLLLPRLVPAQAARALPSSFYYYYLLLIFDHKFCLLATLKVASSYNSELIILTIRRADFFFEEQEYFCLRNCY
jgi:hypothetical protein